MMLLCIMVILFDLLKVNCQNQILRGNIYRKSFLQDVVDGQYLLTQFKSKDFSGCLFRCTETSTCYVARYVVSNWTCEFHKLNALFNLANIPLQSNVILFKKPIDYSKLPNMNGLTNYWPLNFDTNDLVGSADLQVGLNGYMSTDRFGNANSAIYVKNGYYYAPPGVYFSGDFTIIAWVKVVSFVGWARLLDFYPNNVVFVILTAGSMYPSFQIFNWPQYSLQSNQTLNYNDWSHFSATLLNRTLSIYINGSLVAIGFNSSIPANQVRNNCYFGRSAFYPNDHDADACFDDIKFYNRALNQQEIIYDMNLII